MLRKSFIFLFSSILLSISISCSQPSGSTSSETAKTPFQVSDKKFATMQEAANYIVANYETLVSTSDNVITLLENTSSSGMVLTHESKSCTIGFNIQDKVLTLENGAKIAASNNLNDWFVFTGSGGKIVSSDNAFICGSETSSAYPMLVYCDDISFENITFKDFYVIIENEDYTGSFTGSININDGIMNIGSTKGTYDIKNISITHAAGKAPSGIFLSAVKEKNNSIIVHEVNAPEESDYQYLLQVGDNTTKDAYALSDNSAEGILNLKNCTKSNLASLTPHCHVYTQTKFVAENCMEVDYIYKKCDCGYISYEITDVRGPHKEVGAINGVAATELTPGTKTHYVCADCGSYFATMEDVTADKVLNDKSVLYEFPPELSKVGPISNACNADLKAAIDGYNEAIKGEETRFVFIAALAVAVIADVASSFLDKTPEKMKEIAEQTNKALENLSITQDHLTNVNNNLVNIVDKTLELNAKIDEIYKLTVLNTYLEIASERQKNIHEVLDKTTKCFEEIMPLIKKHKGTCSDEVIDELNEWGRFMRAKGLSAEYFLRSFYEETSVTFDGAYVSYMDAINYRAAIIFPFECEGYINYMTCVKIQEEPVSEIATLAYFYYLYSTDVADATRETAIGNLSNLYKTYKKEYDAEFKIYNERYKPEQGTTRIEVKDLECFIPGVEGFFYGELKDLSRMTLMFSKYKDRLCDAWNPYIIDDVKNEIKRFLWYSVTWWLDDKEYRMLTTEVSNYLVQYLAAGKFINEANYVDALKYMGYDLTGKTTLISGGINCYDQGKKYIGDCGRYLNVADKKEGDVCHLIYMEPHTEIYRNPDDYFYNNTEYEGRITRVYEKANLNAYYMVFRPVSGW